MAGYPSRAPTMNIHPSRTELGRADPLKHIFRALFEVLPREARGHTVATIGEFIGTMLFFILAFGGVEAGNASTNKDQGSGVSTKPPGNSPGELIYIALSAGFALIVCIWTFFRISGGLFNPVVSLGMALIGAITWARCFFLIIAQTSATIIASYIVNALFNGGFNVAVGLGGGTSPAQGVVIEMILTAQLIFVIFMLAAEEHAATHLAPIGIGLSLFVAELVGVFWTGGGVNPARALAPCIVNRNFPQYHWIYWVGPIAGSILAVLVFKLVKALEYETAQDEDGHEKFLLKHNQQRRHTSIAPLSGVGSAHGSIELQAPPKRQQAPAPKAAPQPAPTAQAAPPPAKKEEVAALPECYAD